MDVGMSVWLPGGELAEYRHVVDPRELEPGDLTVGAVHYEMLEAMSAWRITMDADVPVRRCEAGSTAQRSAHLELDVRFDATAPAIGTDGQARTSQRSAVAAAAAETVGKGHLEQAGRWSGQLVIDGVPLTWGEARGNRDRSWGPRRWGGPSMWRWFSINVPGALDLGGIRLGTSAGDLHRGWVWDGAEATSVEEWRVRTELDADGLTQHVVHLDVLDKRGREHHLRGDVLRVADIGRAGGTVVNEGLTRWTSLGPLGEGAVGYGIAEYLHQVDAEGTPVVAVQ
jgi:hypothetical protein